jgi:hypothetical protein
MFGFGSTELIGKRLRIIAARPEALDGELHSVTEKLERLGEELLESQSTQTVLHRFQTVCKHKYGNSIFKVDISASAAEGGRILVFSFRQVEQSGGVLAMDAGSGIIKYCSASVERMLHYEPGEMSAGTMSLHKVLPMPYALVHQKFVEEWSQKFLMRGGAGVTHRPISCASGRAVLLQGKVRRAGCCLPFFFFLSIFFPYELIFMSIMKRSKCPLLPPPPAMSSPPPGPRPSPPLPLPFLPSPPGR